MFSALIAFLPYVLIPLLMVLLFRKAKTFWISASFLITIVLLSLYPLCYSWLYHYLNSTQFGSRLLSGNEMIDLSFNNLIVIIPLSLSLQYFILSKLVPENWK